MKLRRLLIPTLCAVLALAAGCRNHREATRPPLPPQADSVAVEADETPLPTPPRYRTAHFNVTAQGTRVEGQLRMQPDSIIWMSATKIIELGRAMCTPDSVVVYVKVAGRCFRGSYMDVYRRFHWHTDFATLQEMLTSDNADAELEALARRFGIDATVHVGDWKEAERLTFPMAIPNQVKPL